VVNRYWLPTIRGAIEISRKNPTKAIDALASSVSYELGNPSPQAEIGAYLYPAYIRGQSYLLLQDGEKAEGEFQKFLTHPGITVNCPLGALAHLQLGRAYTLMHDPAKARAAYDNFFALWKDADPDIPVLKQARTEYAELR
jgi:tetratricopeptide (TPR) repeat protein